LIEILEKAIPVLTLVIGWSLNELSRKFGKNSAHKEAIGRALFDLLEIRHRLITVQYLTTTMAENYTIPNEARPHIRKLLEDMIWPLDNISERYEVAVNLIAGKNPIAAFKWASGGQIPALLNKLKSIFREHGIDSAEIYDTEIKLTKILIPKINEIAFELGSMHSMKSASLVENIINSNPDIPDELKSYFANLNIETQS